MTWSRYDRDQCFSKKQDGFDQITNKPVITIFYPSLFFLKLHKYFETHNAIYFDYLARNIHLKFWNVATLTLPDLPYAARWARVRQCSIFFLNSITKTKCNTFDMHIFDNLHIYTRKEGNMKYSFIIHLYWLFSIANSLPLSGLYCNNNYVYNIGTRVYKPMKYDFFKSVFWKTHKHMIYT